ncbi:MAG: YihY/virulence factor BrkB family protein [Propionibacteriaceae bacterium]|nr:YihY/virulence factor BrkB family protein [Propionibacteriaceae bacterium]
MGRAVDRFNRRLGGQSAAAMAFFSVLTLIPALMVACAGLGAFLDLVRPDLMQPLERWLTELTGDLAASRQLMGVVGPILADWRSVGLTALVLAAYAGANWINHLRQSIEAIWHDQPSGRPQAPYPLRMLRYAGLFAVFAPILLVSLAGSSVASWLAQSVLLRLGLSHSLSAGALIRLAGWTVNLVLGWLLFLGVFGLAPRQRRPWSVLARGAALGAVGLGIIQLGASWLIRAVSRNQTAILFGPVVVIMLVFNVVCHWMVWVAAWTATASPRPVGRGEPAGGEAVAEADPAPG